MDMVGSFPLTRLRRLRTEAWCRELVAESHLDVKNLIQPLFIHETSHQSLPYKGFYSVYPNHLEAFVEKNIFANGLSKLALFPVIASEMKDHNGSAAFDGDGFFIRSIVFLKKRFPDLQLIIDVALDPFTNHGHDGLIQNGDVANDLTSSRLADLSCLYADAGADIVAPSDMMDGRIGVIRRALDESGHTCVKILSYAAKYASHFYGPFRKIMGGGNTAISKATYQMDVRNSREALREAALDINEGADFLMIKPALLSLDVLSLLRESTSVPLFAYHVSGEYAMLCSAAEKGFVDYEKGLWEILSVLKRAGASGIVTYGAVDAARLMKVAATG